ncbi:AAA domain-containing protein [Favolaschia claudopus]|uniref:AAA domain-containing protein n=1 Tax=Favolaschia claudopus TaxID=2862362 RepID=A0AAV9ZZY2_9AGAR
MAPASDRMQRLLVSAKTAASILQQISQFSPTPFLGTTASISASVLGNIEVLKSSGSDTVQVLQDIDDILNGILTLLVDSGAKYIPPALLQDIGFFAETLNKLQVWLDSKQRTSKIRRLFRQSEEAAQLEACKAGMKQALNIFKSQSRVPVTIDLGAMERDLQAQHEDVLLLIDPETDTVQYISCRSNGTLTFPQDRLSKLGTSSGSFSLLPATPKIFHGREFELADLVDMLSQSVPRIVILGPGGMGKTSLAIASLHDDQVVGKYPARYFVSCDSAYTVDALVATVASNLDIKPSRGLAKAVVRRLSEGPSCLMILDNFETSWEPVENRTPVEEFLSLLAEIPHLALLITMRGAERPGKAQWSRPFLRPLTPLTQLAARQTFIDVADDVDDTDAHVDELLAITDNVPLAIQLVASIASSEGCAETLQRWKQEHTALLSDGFDKRSNLEFSIMLSLSSPRMLASPHAEQLLRLLSLLSDGIADIDLIQSKVSIPDVFQCKTTLIRTSLVYVDHTGRSKVLAPICEYILNTHSPAPESVRPLRDHFTGSSISDLMPRLLSNLGNMHAVLLYGLDQDPVDIGGTIRTAFLLSRLTRVMCCDPTPLLARVLKMLPATEDDPALHAHLITEQFQLWQFSPMSNPQKSMDEAMDYFRRVEDLEGEALFYNVVAEYHIDHVSDPMKGKTFFELALNLASQCDSAKQRVRALSGLAAGAWFRGDYAEGRRLAHETYKIALVNGDTIGQQGGNRWEAMCATALGDFKGSLEIIAEGKALLRRLKMEGSDSENMLMNSEAYVHTMKTEFAEARRIQEVILRRTSQAKSPISYAHALINIASLDTYTGGNEEPISQYLDTATSAFQAARYPRGISACELARADLLLREGQPAAAGVEYLRLLKSAGSSDDEIAVFCIMKLADPTHPVHGNAESGRWAVVYFAFTMRGPSRNQLALHQALRCLGDVLTHQGDDDSAFNVLEVALQRFTTMDVHQHRAECMRTMGDILFKRKQFQNAREMWVAARPLFKRSQQVKEVVGIDGRLDLLDVTEKLVQVVPIFDLPLVASGGRRDAEASADAVCR